MFNLDGTNNHNLGTWIELSWDAPPARTAWADVSLLEGYDGAALIAATDGSGSVTGFGADLMQDAPLEAIVNKTGSVSGNSRPALGKTVGDEANNEARSWELSLLSATTQAFVVQAFKPVIESGNGRFDVTMYKGTY
jgi:hypothetical protein